ncbi:unnamed protein product [Heterobilharzia americana]|nr:unnamed protein product [Heterobilharzia americana]CAH8654592.1 unnamed protein product [Heterobilharzia americana]
MHSGYNGPLTHTQSTISVTLFWDSIPPPLKISGDSPAALHHLRFDTASSTSTTVAGQTSTPHLRSGWLHIRKLKRYCGPIELCFTVLYNVLAVCPGRLLVSHPFR